MEEIKLQWPQDAAPLPNEKVLGSTRIMAADSQDEDKMVSITVDQLKGGNPYITLEEDFAELDFTPRLDAALSLYDVVLLNGSFDMRTLPNKVYQNKHILGIDGKTTINVLGDIATGNTFELAQNCSMENVRLVGSFPTPDPTSSEWFDTIDGALAVTHTGRVNGVKLSHVSSYLRNVTLQNFSGTAVLTSKNNIGASGLSVNSGLYNCRIFANYIGVTVPEESEYLSFSDTWINYNIVGVNKAGGNNTFANCRVDHNKVNFITRKGHNNSHGGFVGGSLNHAKFANIIADEITNGDVFSGVNMFDGGKWGIYIRRCLGLNISGNIFGRMPIYCAGSGLVSSAPGTNKISGNVFNLNSLGSAATNKVYRNYNENTGLTDPATPDNCELRDNVHMEGDSRRDSSNWDPMFINDYKFPDSNGFMYGETIAGTQSSRYVSGTPIDGVKFINGAGAIAIELPIPNFNNTQMSFDIDISSTVAGKSAKLQFSSYAVTADGGTWVGSTWINVSGYKIRLGRKSDGKPVIYIAELGTVFTNTIVRINKVTIHQGAYALPKYWQTKWVIRQETVAFENISPMGVSPDVGTAGIADYNGDLNAITTTGVLYASTAGNRPIAENGFIETFIQGSSINVRMQRYTSVISGASFTRGRINAVDGYTAWV